MSDIMHKWHQGTRPGNDGNAGNTLEDLLGVSENNLSLPDYGEIEIKSQKKETGSLITLFHKEPRPPASIPKLLRSLGWQHSEAGTKKPADEMSFRSTTYAHRFSDRGFKLNITASRIEFIFDPNMVNKEELDRTYIYRTYGDWLQDVNKRSDPHYTNVLPIFYELSDIENKFVEKLNHTLFVLCRTRKERGVNSYCFENAFLLKGLKTEMISLLFNDGSMAIDFDARTRHNHGTKFRIQAANLASLFSDSVELD